MARDPERYAYFMVALPRTSQTLQKLLAEAQEAGINPARLIALRVSDWYQGSARSTREASPMNDGRSAILAEDIAAQNADAALDAW
jgi:hypothetical protein